jgi:hypothetical protein
MDNSRVVGHRRVKNIESDFTAPWLVGHQGLPRQPGDEVGEVTDAGLAPRPRSATASHGPFSFGSARAARPAPAPGLPHAACTHGWITPPLPGSLVVARASNGAITRTPVCKQHHNTIARGRRDDPSSPASRPCRRRPAAPRPAPPAGRGKGSGHAADPRERGAADR